MSEPHAALLELYESRGSFEIRLEAPDKPALRARSVGYAAGAVIGAADDSGCSRLPEGVGDPGD